MVLVVFDKLLIGVILCKLVFCFVIIFWGKLFILVESIVIEIVILGEFKYKSVIILVFRLWLV